MATQDVAWLFGQDRTSNRNESEFRCSDVWEVAEADRCTFVLSVADCRSGEALFDYVELLYCRWDVLALPTILPLVGLFIVCGGLVCALAGGFVTPALVLLKGSFKLDEAKAGATLLTLGNGLPDIMGAVAAVQMGHEGLVVGEVLGGTLFVVGVIVGALYTVGGRAPLGQGFAGMLAFFGAAVLYVGHIYATGAVTGLHIAIGAGIYVAYYVYIFSLPSEKDGYEAAPDEPVDVGVKRRSGKKRPAPTENSPLLKTTLTNTDSVLTVPLDLTTSVTAGWRRSLLKATFSCLETVYEVLAYIFQFPFTLLVPMVSNIDEDDGLDDELPRSHRSMSATSTTSIGSALRPRRSLSRCFDWNELRFLLYPLLLVAASGLSSIDNTTLFALLGLSNVVVYRLTLCVVSRRTADTLVTFAGFVLSLCFLHRLTSELVAVVRAMGLATRLADEVMGLSILTYGNFVGDISTYIAVVNRGCLQMALTGCISSALMALLFNISLAFSLRLATQGVWLCPLTQSTVTTVLMGAVALCPVILALFAIGSKCHSSVSSGVCLILYYASIMVLLVYTQI